MNLLLKDGRGKPSITLTMLVPAMLIIAVSYAFQCYEAFTGDVDWPLMADFGAAYTLIGAVWWKREETEKAAS